MAIIRVYFERRGNEQRKKTRFAFAEVIGQKYQGKTQSIRLDASHAFRVSASGSRDDFQSGTRRDCAVGSETGTDCGCARFAYGGIAAFFFDTCAGSIVGDIRLATELVGS